ncbi:MAG TPA: hypothetical protein VGA70_04695 [Longimicrobiales bacterium]|jgi:hypothetical protein
MDHLSTEGLARLLDQGASQEEYRHLADCRACRAEMDAIRDQTEALGRLPDLRPPPGDWSVLQARLVSEGLVRAGGQVTRAFGPAPGWMRAAAALVLFLGGAVAGGVAARGVGLPFSGDRVAREGSFLVPASDAGTVDDAFQWVQLTERQYMDALVRYRQLRSDQGGAMATSDAESRYAALEYMVRAGQAALREAPTDPFLNGLVASTMAEREAWLKLISSNGNDNWF